MLIPKFSNFSLVAIASFLALAAIATAGSLTPSGAPTIATMHSVGNIYDVIASTAYDSSSFTANQNGSLIQQLKYIDSQAAWASSSNNIWSLNSGNVGIGTTSPDTRLDVVGNITASTSGNVGLIIKSTSATSTDGQFTILTASTSDRLDIRGGAGLVGNTLMTIASSGNVGIGTTGTTLGRLSVGSNASVGKMIVVNDIYGNISQIRVRSSYPCCGIYIGDLDFYADSTANGYTLNRVSGSIQMLTDGIGGTTGAIPAAIRFLTGPAGAAALTERMRISSSGNVGINVAPNADGTNNVDAQLEIVGSTSFTTGSIASISGTALAGGSIFNITVPASSSANNPHGLMLVKNVTGTTIASWSMGGTLSLAGKILSDGANASCTGVNVGGSGCIDYAESFPTSDPTLSAGEVVAIDPAISAQVVRATTASTPLGIVSTHPAALITGSGLLSGSSAQENPSSTVPIALAGRVPVKISEENGTILPGDHLTVSVTIPGVAMKQIASGMTLGIALEPSQNQATVLTFVTTSYWAPTVDTSVAGSASTAITFGNRNWSFDSFFQMIVDAFKNVFGIGFEKGKIQADQLCAGNTCINEQQLQKLLQEMPSNTPVPSETPVASETPTPSPEITPLSTPSDTPTDTPTP